MKSMSAFLDSEQLEDRFQISSEYGGLQGTAHSNIVGKTAIHQMDAGPFPGVERGAELARPLPALRRRSLLYEASLRLRLACVRIVHHRNGAQEQGEHARRGSNRQGRLVEAGADQVELPLGELEPREGGHVGGIEKDQLALTPVQQITEGMAVEYRLAQ